MTHPAFYMYEGFRQSLLAEHSFYVQQAEKRLLSQFKNMVEEADQASKRYLEEASTFFNPDRDDPDHYYEAAEDAGQSFYVLLTEMRDNTRLSVVSSMFHQWDKKLRSWIVDEVRHWHTGEGVAKELWSQDFAGIMEFLAAFGWDGRTAEWFDKLNALRLVVNVYKHGEGKSLQDLKVRYRQYLLVEDGWTSKTEAPLSMVDHTMLNVSDEHISEFSVAITQFWRAIPQYIHHQKELHAPLWFEKAWNRDQVAKK